MEAKQLSLETIFGEAVEIAARGDRDAYLDRACGRDESLRRQVESLLVAHDRAGDFLGSPTIAVTADQPRLSEGPGTTIGSYKLLEVIGEGGMGTVYMAEQTEPVRRRVALKVIKPGMDTKQVIARFEAERQALAMMDHPNIARVFDGGVTPSGRPYFVMELVRGLPVTDYCDQNRLAIPDRLELFVLVCRAVQHAHQKGVVHRDLKPSNVLVTVIDGVGVPKVIDFGVAKATGQSLTEKTLFTAFSQMIGTPLYMSPEQAELSGTDVDTRSDIYSLGVLLYELLTGTTPFDEATFRNAALDELRRIIREQEPPTPSTRLSSLGERLPTVSARRGADPRRLGSSLRGELDWVVMKALEKDRRRRYESAGAFAADVQRYRLNEPVEAGPPSAWYRFSKYARRHRAALMTATLLAVSLIAGTVVSAWQAVRAREAEERATQERDHARVAQERADSRFRLAFRAIAQLSGVRGELRSAAGPERTERIQHAIGDDLRRYYEQIVENNENDPAVTYEIGDAYLFLAGYYGSSDPVKAKHYSSKALEHYERKAREKPDDPGILNALAWHLKRLAGAPGNDPQRAEADYRRAIALCEQVARDHPRRLDDYAVIVKLARDFGSLLRSQGRSAEAEDLDRRVLAWFLRPEFDPFHLEKGEVVDDSYFGLWVFFVQNGRLQEAIAVLEAARPHLLFDGQFQGYLDKVTKLCFLLALHADPALRARAVVLARENLEFMSRSDAASWLVLAMVLDSAGNSREAVDAFRHGFERCRDAGLVHQIGSMLILLGKHRGAIACLSRAAELDPGDPSICNDLAWCLVTCPDPAHRDVDRGVKLARKAVDLKPTQGSFWNTFGVALYRDNDWTGAADALSKSMSVSQTHSAHDAFFLAMARWRLGDTSAAQNLYGRAVTWMEENAPHDQELVRFRAEAEALLRVDVTAPKKGNGGVMPDGVDAFAR
jgi:serine/threonine protein kinase/tetratricopeptide (TPR) repeat protein